MALPLFQAVYCWFKDDAGLNSATAAAAQNTALNWSPSVNIRLRTKHYCSTTATGLQFKLQYSKNGAAYADTPIIAGGDLQVIDSANYTSHAATTERLNTTTGTWADGQGMDVDITSNAMVMTNKKTEHEWCLVFAESAANSTYTFKAICLQIGQNYTVIPSISIKNYRLRIQGGALRIQGNKLRLHKD